MESAEALNKPLAIGVIVKRLKNGLEEFWQFFTKRGGLVLLDILVEQKRISVEQRTELQILIEHSELPPRVFGDEKIVQNIRATRRGH
jgi:hypothetical protein